MAQQNFLFDPRHTRPLLVVYSTIVGGPRQGELDLVGRGAVLTVKTWFLPILLEGNTKGILLAMMRLLNSLRKSVLSPDDSPWVDLCRPNKLVYKGLWPRNRDTARPFSAVPTAKMDCR